MNTENESHSGSSNAVRTKQMHSQHTKEQKQLNIIDKLCILALRICSITNSH